MSPLENIVNRPGVDPQLVADINRNFQRLRRTYDSYAIDSDYVFVETDQIASLQVDATDGALTVTLPSPTGSRCRRVIKTDSSGNTVTLIGTVNGVSGYTLAAQYDFVEVEPTGEGWLVVDYGLAVPSFNGITFPAVQVPSSNPNTLDDYEEGTWTPSLGGNATYTELDGSYTKIGRQVFISFNIRVNVLGTGSAFEVSGLPFTSDALYYNGGIVFYHSSLALSVVKLDWLAVRGSGNLQFCGTTAASASSTIPLNIFGNGAIVLGSGHYIV